MNLLSFRDKKTNLYIVPGFLAVSWLACQHWFTTMLLTFVSVIPLHEMGHAMAAWMGGRIAVPVGAIVPSAALTFIGNERSPIFSFVFFGVLLFGVFKAYQARLYFWLLSGCGIFAMSLWMTFGYNEMELSNWISYAGIAGEFCWGTWLIVAYYNPLTENLRWDFFRYPFLASGSFSFVHASQLWWGVKRGVAQMPLGAAISSDGARDTSGDLNRLLAMGWSPSEITQRYLSLGKIGLIVISISYVYFLMRTEDEASEASV